MLRFNEACLGVSPSLLCFLTLRNATSPYSLLSSQYTNPRQQKPMLYFTTRVELLGHQSSQPRRLDTGGCMLRSELSLAVRNDALNSNLSASPSPSRQKLNILPLPPITTIFTSLSSDSPGLHLQIFIEASFCPELSTYPLTCF